ncbi:CorA Mg2+ and Co2+ transporter [Pyrenophora tritici-repentis]|nr:CorA Mg2+ and Co2+ transporter [Pyrenophora tritici-repentis]KAI1690313.1 CorA Mg2+ transporter protein [Pyrenophora tritici-repentis]
MSGSEESTRYRQDYDHIITINLKAGVSEPRKSTIARANTQRFQDSPGVSRVDLAVTTSAIYRTGRGAQNVRITTRKPDENARAECKATNRWIHTKAQSMSLNVFEDVAINFAHDHDGDLMPVTIHLFKQVREHYKKQSVYGSYIQHGTVLRCGGTYPAIYRKPDISAIFISFPYFDVDKNGPHHAPKLETTHLPRGLFQNAFPQEAARDRDDDQMFKKSPSIPQEVEFVAEDTPRSGLTSLVHVTDHLKRIFYLPVADCRTYFALERRIGEDCFAELPTLFTDCVIHAGDRDGELDARAWQELLTTSRCEVIYLRLGRRPPQPTHHQARRQPVRILRTPRMIEYGNLNSDNDVSDTKNKALVSRNARVKRWNLGGNAQYAGVQAPEVQQSLEISRSHSQIEGHDAEEQEEGKEGEKVEYTSDVGEAEPTSSPINYAQFVNPVFFHVLPFLSWPTNMEDDITGEDANTPSNSQHDVAELFHGILSTIQDQMTFSNMVVNITDNSAQYHQDRDCGRDLDYVIRNVPQVDYMKLHRLMELPIPLDDCTTCRRDVRYSTISEALQHLKDHHVQSMFGTAQFTRTKISHWIASVSGLGYTCEGLCQQLEKSTKVLRYNIEIAEKGNTRAIRVFTLVTIILLPLSFISSLFGMNTSDIRDNYG